MKKTMPNSDLLMSREETLDLEHKALELLVERIEMCPQEILGRRVPAGPRSSTARGPTRGREAGGRGDREGSARNPSTHGAKRSSPILRVRPVIAHLARRGGRLHGRRLPREPVHLDGRERPQPAGAGRHRLVQVLDRLRTAGTLHGDGSFPAGSKAPASVRVKRRASPPGAAAPFRPGPSRAVSGRFRARSSPWLPGAGRAPGTSRRPPWRLPWDSRQRT